MKKLESTRIAFTEGLMALAETDPRIVLVCADSLKVIKGERFAERFPERYFDAGIAEQNAAAFAAGLAACGLIPFFATYAGFITMRACEQLRTFTAYPGLNVRFVGANGGMASGEREGVTHQFFEDIGIVRSIPGITVVVPSDAGQVRQAVKAAAYVDGPVYLRLGSGRDPVGPETENAFKLGKIRRLKETGTAAAIFVSGLVVNRALEAAALLDTLGIGTAVVEIHTLKPLDTAAVAGILKQTGAAVTIEDHNIIGGLGSAIAEVAAAEFPVPLERVGLQDIYPQSGEPEALLDHYGIGVINIVEAVKKAAARKEKMKG